MRFCRSLLVKLAEVALALRGPLCCRLSIPASRRLIVGRGGFPELENFPDCDLGLGEALVSGHLGPAQCIGMMSPSGADHGQTVLRSCVTLLRRGSDPSFGKHIVLRQAQSLRV